MSDGPVMDEESQRQSIIERGFRSPSIELDCVQAARARHTDWTVLGDDTNVACQRLLHAALNGAAGHEVGSVYSVATRLFIRTASNFQGALILAERGMPVEAQSLARACFENAILIGSLKDFDQDTLTHLASEERSSALARLKILAALLDSADDTDAAYRAEVERGIATLDASPKHPAIGLKELSTRAGLLSMYLYFRQLSANSTHASVSSLHGHLWILDGQIEGLQIGPDLDRFPATVAMACMAVIAAGNFLASIISHFDCDGDLLALNARLSELGTRLPKSEVFVLAP
jgi:hypothetical protein